MKSRAPSVYAHLPEPYRIGIAGAGAIVKAAHLPAYRKAGFPVAAIFDPVRAKAEALAAEFAIPSVCDSLEELLEHPRVQVVDIAAPPARQPEIALQAIARGKHLLCQKPLAGSTRAAQQVVDASRDAGVKLAVNVNLRWDAAMRETQCCLLRGDAGEWKAAEFIIRYYENWSSWPWLMTSPRLLFAYDTIHILDITRTLFGDPDGVSAQLSRDATGQLRGETAGIIELTYGGGRRVRIETDSTVPASQTEARFSICGSQGTIAGTLGIYYDYPVGRPDTWNFNSAEKRSVHLEERWIPDAFAGTMGELFRSIREDRDPANSGDDHLKTLRLLDAIYHAAAAGLHGNGENYR